MTYAESVVTVSLRLEKKDVRYVKAQTFNSLALEKMEKIIARKMRFTIDATNAIQIYCQM